MNYNEMESYLPKLILQQMKWLDNIIEPSQLSRKIWEVIDLSPRSIQRDIITSLPEIIPDSEHKTVVAGLVEILDCTLDLTVPILDALSNLDLQPDMLTSARNHVVSKLESAELDDLPIVIKFLLQTVEPDTVGDMIETIRSNLDLRSIVKLRKNQKARAKDTNMTSEILVIDALKTGIRFQKFVADAWYKALVAITQPGQHKVIDIIVILILHSIVSMKQKVQALFRKKIIEGQITKKLIEETIIIHGTSLREYMSSILSISENLLRSSANYPIVARAASALYTHSFHVSDPYYRQEIVGSLLVHIGSGSGVEIDASLSVLQNIVQVSRAALNELNAFIKGVLDYLDNLTLEQIRLFFIDESTSSSSLLTELNIFIRKQLSNPMESVKKVGVMGAIAMVYAFGVIEDSNGAVESMDDSVPKYLQAELDPTTKISVQFLVMIRDSCQKSAVCLAMAYDELAYMVLSKQLSLKLTHWIKEEFSNQFVGTFVAEVNDIFTLQPNLSIALERWMNLDGPESELAIKIMPSLCMELPTSSSQMSTMTTPDGIAYLCSLFKLLQATEKATGENGLDDIDGLLGCGITMFKREYVEDIAEIYDVEIRHVIVQGLLSAINWFREIINAFSYDAGDQTMARIILRLQQISEIEEIFRHVLKTVPGFRPLESGTIKSKDLSSRSLPSSSMMGKSGTQMGMGSSKATLRATQSEDISSSSKLVSGEGMVLESLAPYLRELELDVFHILRVCEPITREVFEISEADSPEIVNLKHKELLFLLKDLLSKINLKLPARTGHIPFAKKTQLPVQHSGNPLLSRMDTLDFAQQVLKFIPYVTAKTGILLSLIHEESESETVIMDQAEKFILLECLNTSLKVILATLSWNELGGSDRNELRLGLLKSLALDNKSKEQGNEIQSSTNISAVATKAFAHMVSWREMMPDFETSVMLLEVLEKVLDLAPRDKETLLQASNFATSILSHRWPISNVIKNDRLAYVLGQQIGKADLRLDLLTKYVTQVLPSFLDQDDECTESHPLLTTNTFTTFTKVLYIQLTSIAGEFNDSGFEETETAFDHILKLSDCFQQLAGFVKSNDRREVLAVTLKHSKLFMEQFIKGILPFVGLHFKGYQSTVAKLFKNHLQTATRSLQAKQTLMAAVPAIKKTMEVLIFQVKLMLENNDAGAAFWLGNLKHRNLAGEEISSQLPDLSDDEGHDSAGEENMDVDDEDEGVHGRSSTSGNRGKKRSRSELKTSSKSGKKSARGPKVKKESKRATEEDDEARIHTKSDMSEDEQDQLSEENDGDAPQIYSGSRAPAVLDENSDDDVIEEVEDEDDDDEGDQDIEEIEERATRRRRRKNPYIDDEAEEEDDEEEEDEDEEDGDEEEEEDDDNSENDA
ncbi:Fanconi anemia group D2 protein [Lunasporangiospora selenospora]|uniref:Fanconi anemia group D2 protein n=1 Tax=Lunasporangiospora selenospora TaxID=979761 RepID=A0A9P6KDL3_9FUNG|nr:Fanconi anemia group D2 protein [Lunasporangiospora selenospora]